MLLDASAGEKRQSRAGAQQVAILSLLTIAAVALHGYHGGVEDAEIYLPGVLQHIDPSLFPKNAEFFNSHAGMTIFPDMVAGIAKLSHAPIGPLMLLFHIACIFGLLFGCYRIARLCFPNSRTVWCGVATVASLLTLPVAGTALYIMDQYVTTRSFSTAASILALSCVLERRYKEAAAWTIFTAAVHPLMALFSIALSSMVFVAGWRRFALKSATSVGMGFFPPVSPFYRDALRSRPYFFLTNWAWYEQAGILGPLVILGAAAWAMRDREGPLPQLLRALAAFEAVFFAAALVISMPGKFERFAEIQPMRCLLLVYVILLLLGGCALGERLLKRRAWRWVLLFAPLCAGMAAAQVELFPASSHVELPWGASSNEWAAAFDWVRQHTPEDAYFALDPNYEQARGEDVHGFRAIAQRSMLADNGKDSGAVTMFPALAAEWKEQVSARANWRQFQRDDFLALKQRYGVDWVVIEQPGSRGLTCPYTNSRVLVCRID